jgi:hypothetical protein
MDDRQRRALSPTRSGSPTSSRPTRVEESTVDFWKSMLRVAFGLFVGEAVAVEIYLLGWPDGPHRVALS